jgi:diaminopimelate dehydrogenase
MTKKMRSQESDDGKIKIAIVGYGNVGKGVQEAIAKSPDMTLSAIITRDVERTKKDFLGGFHKLDIPCNTIYDIRDNRGWLRSLITKKGWRNKADVAILCGGSKEDLPEQGPYFAKYFNTVDSFDTHANIPAYFKKIDEIANANNNVSVISTGWDPGTFSLERTLADSFIPGAHHYTFWGPGVSQGHSDAIRKVKGVKDAIQYTMPIQEAVDKVKSGSSPDLKTKEKHWRDCYVVADESEQARIEKEIQTMPNYFADYKTRVTFVPEKEMAEMKKSMPHGGFVIATGTTGNDSKNKAIIEYRNQWDSNPEATGNILVAHARAAYKMSKEGKSGAFTILDIPAAYLSMHSKEKLLAEFM